MMKGKLVKPHNRVNDITKFIDSNGKPNSDANSCVMGDYYLD
jgi:hypothetical protein